MSDDWREIHMGASGRALQHPLVRDVMDEYADNMGFDQKGLPWYGLSKVARYVAAVARAEALGFDPDLLRLSRDEANSAQMTLAAELVLRGVPTFIMPTDPPASPLPDFG